MAKISIDRILQAFPNLKKSGGEYKGQCPACGGDDRFSATPTDTGDTLIHCRQCDDAFKTVLAAIEKPKPKPALKAVRANMTTWKQSRPVQGTPAETYLHNRNVKAIPDTCRWTPGRLLYGYAAGREGAVSAYSAERLDPDGNFPPARDRKTHGTRKGKCFIAQRAEIGAPLVVAEGEVSAMVVASQYPGSWVVATGGTAGMKSAADWIATDRVTIELDGDEPGRAAGTELYHSLVAKGKSVTILDRPDGTDPADHPTGHEITPDPPVEGPLAWMDKRFVAIRAHGRKSIVWDRKHDDWQLKSEFQSSYAHDFLEIGDKVLPAGKAWLDRTTNWFDRMVCDPSGKQDESTFNTWQGFGVRPVPGTWIRFQDLMTMVICAGNLDHAKYLTQWLARMFRHPDLIAESAIVLAGQRGVGKTFFAKTIGHLVGRRHYRKVVTPEELTGDFNGHLQDVLFLFSDEAYNPKIKGHTSTLKNLVTGEDWLLHDKGLARFPAKNITHLMMASNDRAIIPAGEFERRFFCLEVSPSNRQDRNYFRAIQDELDAGGYEALMHHLLHQVDIDGFDPRDIPWTEGLRTQQIESLSPVMRWWRARLDDAELPAGEEWAEAGKVVPTSVLYHDFAEFNGNQSRRADEMAVSDAIGAVVPGLRKTKTAIDGLSRRWCYVFPPLSECRREWEERYGPQDWEDEELELA